MLRSWRRGSPPRSRHAIEALAGRTFWTLVAIAVLAAGWLSTALAAAASALTGLQVATSGLVLISAVVLAARVLSAIERARRRSTDHPPNKE